MRFLVEKKKEKEFVSTLQQDLDLFESEEFNGLSEYEKRSTVMGILYGLWNKDKLQKSFDFYLKELAEEPNSKRRIEYLKYLQKLNIDLGPNMSSNIKYFADEGKLDLKHFPKYLNDQKFYQNETDLTAANKLKTIIYFEDPKNIEKWQKDGYDIIAHLKNEDGSWKTYNQMDQVIDEIENLPSNKGLKDTKDQIEEAVINILNLDKKYLNRKEVTELVELLLRYGDTTPDLIQKALQAMQPKT